MVCVEYDSSVFEKFNDGFFTTVAVADSYDADAIASGDIHSLTYTETKNGFFVLPENFTSLIWHFEGTHPAEGKIVKEAVIRDVKPAVKYTIRLKYSKDAPGSLAIDATVEIAEPEHRDDKVAFSPDPTVKGEDVNRETPYNYTGGARNFTIAALDTISQLNITYGEQTFDLINNTYEGVAVTKISAKDYTVALSEQFFANLYGGTQTIAFRIKDASGGVGYQECTCFIEGILPLESYDLWFSTANFSAYCYSSEGITIGYRVAGGEWAQLPVTASGVENLYNATATDFAAATTYEYALFENGVQLGLALSITTPAGTQIPAAGFEKLQTTVTIGALRTPSTYV
jgi:hypothetical protein